MKKHGLPRESGDSAWFERLNPFEQQETRRQVKFKRRHWPELADGFLINRPTYSYPHILPKDHLDKAFCQEIRKYIFSYCSDNDVSIHSQALNLRSSQVACFNVIFRLRLNLQLAKKALEPLLPGVTNVKRIEFEYTGDEGATKWLGEPPGGKRGQNRTSIDVAIWWEDSNKRVLTLVEWKYTERSFGHCGGFLSRGNKSKQTCRKLDILSPNVAEKCYLAQGNNPRLSRHYWDHMKEAGINLKSLKGIKGCPFRGPFYQLLRQYLLAAYLRKSDKVDRVDVALVAFSGNSSVLDLPPYLSELGDSIVDAWNALLVGVPELRYIEVEKIIEAMKSDSSGASRPLLDYLKDRYGL